MTQLRNLQNEIFNGKFEDELLLLYKDKAEVQRQRKRYIRVLDSFADLFGENKEVELFSAPGRSEVGGNHTDHNHGRVLAAGINLDAVAAASKNDENIVRIKSENYNMDTVSLSQLDVVETEMGKSISLVRGVCAGFLKWGYKVGGFDSTTASDVLSGSGMSSSAAFEVLVGTILNHLYNNGNVTGVEIAQIAQYAENKFFDKPCGLMDQTACSVGGFVTIDFNDPSNPVIEKVDFDFASCGHYLCIVDTGGSHSDLTDEYAAVRQEMESVAQMFGKKVLREVKKADFMDNISQIRSEVGDRAILRAIHFYEDNERVLKQVESLNNGDFETFKALVIDSGNSSYMFNQNVFDCSNPSSQPVSLALAMSRDILNGCGAWRVHGGGFAGTMQAFVPTDKLVEYKSKIEAIFGDYSCHVLTVRPVGGIKIQGT